MDLSFQISQGRQVWFNGIPSSRPSVDLVVADLPKGLPGPGLSGHADAIPSWNEKSATFTNSVFFFCKKFLHDDGALLVFQPLESRRDLLGYMKAANLEIAFFWTCYNTMVLSHPLFPGHKVLL